MRLLATFPRVKRVTGDDVGAHARIAHARFAHARMRTRDARCYNVIAWLAGARSAVHTRHAAPFALPRGVEGIPLYY